MCPNVHHQFESSLLLVFRYQSKKRQDSIKIEGSHPKSVCFHLQAIDLFTVSDGWLGGKPDLNYSEYMGVLQTLNHYKDLTIGGGENTSQKALLLRLFS